MLGIITLYLKLDWLLPSTACRSLTCASGIVSLSSGIWETPIDWAQRRANHMLTDRRADTRRMQESRGDSHKTEVSASLPGA